MRIAMLVMAIILMAFVGFDLWLMQVQPLDNPTWDFLALIPTVSCAIACTVSGTKQ